MLKKKCLSIVMAVVMTLTLSTGAVFATESDQVKPVLPKENVMDLADKIATVKDDASWEDTAAENAKRLFGNNNMLRIYGSNRYDTALATADHLKKSLGCDKFDFIIVASGESYPDALTGSFLAYVAEAPILLVDHQANTQDKVLRYIENNLDPDGHVYVLGGTGVISGSFEQDLRTIAAVKRLGGTNRYETNLAILKESLPSAIEGMPVLICSGNGFADSLSASAVGCPVLLAGDQLTAQQIQFLDEQVTYGFIIGGYGAVNARVENQVGAYTEDSVRIAGDTRYETSADVAAVFFEDPDYATLAYAQNFPDGLSAGPLASEIGAPLLLVDNRSYQMASWYAELAGIQHVAVLGGPALISDKVARAMIQK